MGGVPLGGAVPMDVTTRAQTGHASETGLACYVRDGKLFMDNGSGSRNRRHQPDFDCCSAINNRSLEIE
jgi:hypothetical protein